MAEEKPTNQPNIGTAIFSWQIPEHDHQQKTINWYVFWVIIALVLIIYSIVTANYLFALIILLILGIAILQGQKKPQALKFAITNLGIKIGKTFTTYRDLKDFWIVYKPPEVKKIFFNPNSALKPTFSIPLQDQNPLKIREFLLDHLKENLDKEDETLTDTLNRIFKF